MVFQSGKVRRMMKACGVTAEYNPFHYGHQYQLAEARKRTQADVMVVVMSGNFLQRGEPAIVDKWTRTKMALASGADLVVELPVSFSVQAADFFAKGAMQLLTTLQCSAVSFGSESGESRVFKQAGNQFIEKRQEIDAAFDALKNDELPYPARIQEAIKMVLPDFPLDLSQPNNQLGFAYAKQLASINDQIDIVAVPRKGAAYSEQGLNKQEPFASATAIRSSLLKNNRVERVSPFLPEKSKQFLQNHPFVSWEDYWPFLHYQLLVSSIEDLQAIYQMEEGIEYRLKEKNLQATSFSDFLSKVKNKRLTRTRLQRLCSYILLQHTKKRMLKEMNEVKPVHILGFSEDGRTYLNEIKEKVTVPLISNITQKNEKLWDLDIKAGEIYRAAHPSLIQKQDFTRKPIVI